MVITGRTITAVCKTDDWAKRYIGEETRVIDLEGKFVLPGLIDAHVDFAAAGARDHRRRSPAVQMRTACARRSAGSPPCSRRENGSPRAMGGSSRGPMAARPKNTPPLAAEPGHDR